jgi:hypothetical protein
VHVLEQRFGRDDKLLAEAFSVDPAERDPVSRRVSGRRDAARGRFSQRERRIGGTLGQRQQHCRLGWGQKKPRAKRRKPLA